MGKKRPETAQADKFLILRDLVKSKRKHSGSICLELYAAVWQRFIMCLSADSEPQGCEGALLRLNVGVIDEMGMDLDGRKEGGFNHCPTGVDVGGRIRNSLRSLQIFGGLIGLHM